MSMQSARELLSRSLVWDMVWPLADFVGNDWGKLERFKAAGYGVISVTLAGDNHNVSQAMEMVAAARKHIFSKPERLLLITSIEDVRRARREGKLGVALHFEGTRCFERNLDLIEAFYALGIRHTLLAFNQTNSCGGGCAELSDGGLSRFGRSFVREMNRVGMLVDLSHVGRRTSLDAIEASAQPTVFTHSNCDALCPVRYIRLLSAPERLTRRHAPPAVSTRGPASPRAARPGCARPGARRCR